MVLLRGMTALVTGSGKENSIGFAIGHELKKQGATVILSDCIKVPTINENGFDYYQMDVTLDRQVENIISTIITKHNNIDILVNCAGILSSTKFLDVTSEEYNSVFDINMKGTFFVTQTVLPYMLKNKFGRIINIGSLSAKQGGGFFASSHYAASKSAVHGFTKALAKEVASSNITVNSVVPGLIHTPMTNEILENNRINEKLTAGIPVGRLGNNYDVAHAVVFLASKESSFITGINMDVNGGAYFD